MLCFVLEYSVIMFDGITGEKRWNVTFFDYASQPAKENEHGNLLFEYLSKINCINIWVDILSTRSNTTCELMDATSSCV